MGQQIELLFHRGSGQVPRLEKLGRRIAAVDPVGSHVQRIDLARGTLWKRGLYPDSNSNRLLSQAGLGIITHKIQIPEGTTRRMRLRQDSGGSLRECHRMRMMPLSRLSTRKKLPAFSSRDCQMSRCDPTCSTTGRKPALISPRIRIKRAPCNRILKFPTSAIWLTSKKTPANLASAHSA